MLSKVEDLNTFTVLHIFLSDVDRGTLDRWRKVRVADGRTESVTLEEWKKC